MASLSFHERVRDYLIQQFNLPVEQIDQMLPEFKRTLLNHMENLEESQKNGADLTELEKAAHTIKGAFLNLGLLECAELAMKIETEAAVGNTSADYAELVADIRDLVGEISGE